MARGGVAILFALFSMHYDRCIGTKEAFHHHIDVDDENIGKLKLSSRGHFTDIIHLDGEAGIKRLLCRDDKIMIAFDESATVPNWRPGQIVLGGSKWACALSPEAGGQHAGIYAKIRDVFRPKQDRLDLVLASVGPFDLLDEASIHFHYDPWASNKMKTTKISRKYVRRAFRGSKKTLFGEFNSKRNKRGVSNMLTDILNRIDWHTNVSMYVPFNYDTRHRRQMKQFSIQRTNGSDKMNIRTGPLGMKDLLKVPEYFSLDCISCSSVARLIYTFDLKIDKVDNKPVLKQYISQVESEIQMQTDFALRFRDEMTINSSMLFWKTQPEELLKIPLAVVPGLPPVELLLSYDMDIIADIQAAVNGPAVLRNKYITKGSYVMSQSLATQSPVQGDVSVFNWTVIPSHSRSMLPSLADVKTSFKHRMGFNASLVWSGKDVSITLSPQSDITLHPTVDSKVTSDYFGKCLRSDISVGGNFSIQKAYFHVQAFGKEIWNTYLASGFQKYLPMTAGKLGEECKARCVGPSVAGFPASIESILGTSNITINRNHTYFSKHFRALRGNSIIFSMAANNSGCEDAQENDVSDHMTNVCPVRLVTRKMAETLARLQSIAYTEWPDRRLVVMKGWNEIIDENLGSPHNLTSPYGDGRAMMLALTDVTTDDNASLCDNLNAYRRLSQLAVCSGFDFSAVRNATGQLIIEVGVTTETQSTEHAGSQISLDHRHVFNKAIQSAGTKYISCPSPTSYRLGDSYPPGRSVELRCGPPVGRIHFLAPKTNQSLYEYLFDDLKFTPEGQPESWCGHELRTCSDCHADSGSGIDVSWDSCLTRLMSPRLALRLRKLANIAKRLSLDTMVDRTLAVQNKLNNSTDLNPLFYEGRAARITLSSSRTSSRMSSLMNAAVCAGFDYVNYTSSEFVDVFVRRQDGYTEKISYYPNGQGFQAVRAPGNLTAEYEYPVELLHEARKPALMDGHNDALYISKYYTISDFKDKAHRDFRLDASLVECLEEASEDLGRKIDIIPGSAYRVRSVNFQNLDTRHKEEQTRYQAGQAVEVNLGKITGHDDLVKLGKLLIRKCQPLLQQQQRCINIGCHQDRLYLDIRPVMAGQETALIRVWNSGADDVYEELKSAADTVNGGGPLISPLHRSSVCASASVVSPDKTYLSFQLGYQPQCTKGASTASPFCANTRVHRSEQANKLQERLTSAAGSDRLPRRDIIDEINACVVDACGGCPGTGSEWDKKVRACSRMIEKYLSRASCPFRELVNKTSFFNPDNHQSTVHSLACHDGQICVENTQLYSLLMPLITSTYRVSAENSVEERLFNNEDNPSPLLELAGQELAMHTAGLVKVYIDTLGDLSRIRNVLKVAMVFNKNVSHVEFHISNAVNKDSVMATIQRKIETWAGTVCSDVSRLSITPFSVHSIHEHRLKRSVERSETRNKAKLDIRNWEMEWLLKL